MDRNIEDTVFRTLDKHAEEIGKVVAERDNLEEEIRSNRYSSRVMKEEMYPKRDDLLRKIDSMRETAIREAKDHINQYRKEAEELNNLNPNALTDDIKLLQSGITLLPRDIEAILKRNEGNRTMIQIALRYAKEHDIEVNTYYIGGEEEKSIADTLDTVLYHYKKWIDKPNGRAMLRKFFAVEE